MAYPADEPDDPAACLSGQPRFPSKLLLETSSSLDMLPTTLRSDQTPFLKDQQDQERGLIFDLS